VSRAVAFIVTLLAGGLVALQPPANSALAKHVGDLGAAFVSLVISTAIIAVLLLATGQPGRLSGLTSFKLEYAVGGLAGATVVLVSLIAVTRLGAGGLVTVLVAAQVLVSVLADRFALYDLMRVNITAVRVIGLVLVIGGTVLVTQK
jgi:transporter family-2 protein